VQAALCFGSACVTPVPDKGETKKSLSKPTALPLVAKWLVFACLTLKYSI